MARDDAGGAMTRTLIVFQPPIPTRAGFPARRKCACSRGDDGHLFGVGRERRGPSFKSALSSGEMLLDDTAPSAMAARSDLDPLGVIGENRQGNQKVSRSKFRCAQVYNRNRRRRIETQSNAAGSVLMTGNAFEVESAMLRISPVLAIPVAQNVVPRFVLRRAGVNRCSDPWMQS